MATAIVCMLWLRGESVSKFISYLNSVIGKFIKHLSSSIGKDIDRKSREQISITNEVG